MPISQNQMHTVLTELGCRTNFSIKKITEYMLPDSKEAFYMFVENDAAQLIIRPAYELFLSDLNSIDGVKSKAGYCHYSEMTRFPTRVHKSANPIHYGIAFTFKDENAAKCCVEKLIAITQGHG
ncbi:MULTISPECIES: hypothetical protein [Corallincola]|nr:MULTISPECIES: hypothetical protein [Corallincola]